jgi:hypothetical protein
MSAFSQPTLVSALLREGILSRREVGIVARESVISLREGADVAREAALARTERAIDAREEALAERRRPFGLTIGLREGCSTATSFSPLPLFACSKNTMGLGRTKSLKNITGLGRVKRPEKYIRTSWY